MVAGSGIREIPMTPNPIDITYKNRSSRFIAIHPSCQKTIFCIEYYLRTNFWYDVMPLCRVGILFSKGHARSGKIAFDEIFEIILVG